MIKICNFLLFERNVQEKGMNQNYLIKIKIDVLLNKFNLCGFNIDFFLVRDNDYEFLNEIFKFVKIVCNM